MSFHEPASGSAPRRRNVATATMFCSSTPTRFVPFATFAGKPSRISSGRVSNEPLPASVLMKPASEADEGHGGEQQRVLVHAGSMRAAAARRRTLATTRGATPLPRETVLKLPE